MARSVKTGLVGQAQPHEDGALVYVIQALVHEPVGALAYRWGPLWPHHLRMAEEAATKLARIHAEHVAIEPLPGNTRVVDDHAAAEAYEAGAAMVSNAARSVRHLAATIAFQIGAEIPAGRVLDDLGFATAAVGIDTRPNSIGYHSIAEIVAVRDAIEHPNKKNLYNGSDTGWGQVPLAWILSNRSLTAYRQYAEWFGLVSCDWQSWLQRRPVQQTTLTVKRGMGSPYPMKKPPKDGLEPG